MSVTDTLQRMPRRIRYGPALLNPLFAWQKLGVRVAETMVASSHVISHRTRRQNNAAELFDMGAEKVEAALESSQALARHLMAMSGRDPMALWRAMPHMLTSSLAPFHARARRNARRFRR